MVENIELHKDQAVFFINPELYSIEAVLNAAYALSEKAYAIIDGDLDTRLHVILKPKSKISPKQLALEFGNELVRAQVYSLESDKQQKVTDAIVGQALNSVKQDGEP